MKKFLNYKGLIVLSFIFLAVYLYKTDTLQIPRLYSRTELIVSFLFLLCSFFFQALNWHQILKLEYPVRLSDAISSVGLSVFTKYIPGKVFVIVGKADYISKKYNLPSRSLIRLSLESQILIIWIGLIVGSISLFWLGDQNSWIAYIIGGILLMGLFLLTPLFQNMIVLIVRRTFKKEINFPHLGLRKVSRLLPMYTVYWLLLGIGFYFFQSAFTVEEIPIYAGFTFPLAATLGILALIAPGGIGVREGILATLIHLSGVDLAVATSIAIVSRLWFLIGESFLFILGLIFNQISKNKAVSTNSFNKKNHAE